MEFVVSNETDDRRVIIESISYIRVYQINNLKMNAGALIGFQQSPTYTDTLQVWAVNNRYGLEYEKLNKYDSKYHMDEANYNHRIKNNKIAKWARVNGFPMLEYNEVQVLKKEGRLPPEYFWTNTFYDTHVIEVFSDNNENPLLTKKDRALIMKLFDFYEIEGEGLTEPPKETPGLDLLRSGEAYKKDNDDLRRMVWKIYTHLKTWINTLKQDSLEQRYYQMFLSDVEKIYFMNGPSTEYIV